jgi:hypothetical protein
LAHGQIHCKLIHRDAQEDLQLKVKCKSAQEIEIKNNSNGIKKCLMVNKAKGPGAEVQF